MSENRALSENRILRNGLKTVRLAANALLNKIVSRKKILMWTYSKETMNSAWYLNDLYQRTMAAQALGWDAILQADEDGLSVYYAETLPVIKPISFYG